MKKLRGHKPGCKCVGCSAETRRRGMAALGLSKRAPKCGRRRAKMVRKAIRKLADSKKFPNPRRAARRLPNMKRRVAKKIMSRLHHWKKPKRGRGYKPSTAIRALHHKRRLSNPSAHLIGTSPVLHIKGYGVYRFPGARLVTGPGEYRVTILGSGSWSLDGSSVRLIDYSHPAKALRAYGRVAPFRHRFTSPARVLSSGSGRIVIESSSRIWEKQ